MSGLVSPMVETYRLTLEHYVSTSDSKIKIEDNKRYEFSFCNGREDGVFGARNRAIRELMYRAEREMVNELDKEQKNDSCTTN